MVGVVTSTHKNEHTYDKTHTLPTTQETSGGRGHPGGHGPRRVRESGQGHPLWVLQGGGWVGVGVFGV